MKKEIERIYSVMRRYNISRRIEGCPCCVSPEWETAITQQPLREIDDMDLLGTYASKAMTTWGTEKNFKHFLPRILETLPIICTNCQIIFSKLAYMSWRENFREVEIEAIEDFVHALWRHSISSASFSISGMDVLECAGIAGIDQAPMLDQLFSQGGVNVISNWAYILEETANDLMQGRIKWIFWESDNEQVVLEWILRHLNEQESWFYGAFEAEPEHEDVSIWQKAIDIITLLRDQELQKELILQI